VGIAMGQILEAPKKQGAESADTPRVTVITAFLNGESFLAEAIESVIAQTFLSWELLLVDDGSSRAATTIAKSYAARHPDQIFYLDHPGHVNRGVTVSRNLGIQHARGEFISILDGDDVWLPSKLTNHVAVLDAFPEVGMVGGTAIYWNSWSGNPDKLVPTGHQQDVVVYPPEAVLALYPLGTAVTPCTSDLLLRAPIVRQVGGFEEEFIGEKQLYEDIAFLTKVYLAVPVYFPSSPTLKYRLHPASCVSTVRESGKYHQVRLYFLEWLERYLPSKRNVDPRVVASLRRALRMFRHPRIHYFLSVPTKIRHRCLRLGARAGRLIWRRAS
jgi:glycosyltransferase involved in cell wall biosynthesis